MKLNKKQQELLDKTSGRDYNIARMEFRRTSEGPWIAAPLRGNQNLPRRFHSFSREEGKIYLIFLVDNPYPEVQVPKLSYVPCSEITHNENFSEVVIVGSQGRVTYEESM